MSVIKHVTLQKIVAHDFRYDPRALLCQKCRLIFVMAEQYYKCAPLCSRMRRDGEFFVIIMISQFQNCCGSREFVLY